MSTLEKIKIEASKLRPDEQVEFFRWWVATEEFKQRQLAALKKDLQIGIEEINAGK